MIIHLKAPGKPGADRNMKTEQFTVKELIEELQAADPEMPVYVWDSFNECWEKLYYAGVQEIEEEYNEEEDSSPVFTIG